MPITTPNFNATQELGNPTVINFQDTSDGSDNDVEYRNIYIRLGNGEYIVQESNTTTNYTEWLYNPSVLSTSFELLTKDVAVEITMDWVDSSSAVLYTKSITFRFTNFNENFDYALTQNLTGNPLLINDNDFFANKSELRTCIDSGNHAFDLVGDLFSAQQFYRDWETDRKSTRLNSSH